MTHRGVRPEDHLTPGCWRAYITPVIHRGGGNTPPYFVQALFLACLSVTTTAALYIASPQATTAR